MLRRFALSTARQNADVRCAVTLATTRTALVILLLAIVTRAVNATLLCADHNLPISEEQRKYCHVDTVLLRVDREAVPRSLARVDVGSRCSGDHCVRVYNYFLQLGPAEIVALGEFPQWRNISPDTAISFAIFRGYNNRVGATDGAVYSRVLERREGQYCIRYELIPPFAGDLLDCDGKRYARTIDVKFDSHVVHPLDAWRVACASLVAGLADKCETNHVGESRTVITRSKAGFLRYLVVLSHYYREDITVPSNTKRLPKTHSPGAPDYYVMLVDPYTREASLLEHAEKQPSSDDLRRRSF